MHIIDSSILSITLASSIWLTIEFIGFFWNRGSGRKVAIAAESTQPIGFNDSVVPFRRPASKLSDRELIKLAKSIGFPGSRKWSFNRKLSGKVRSELQLKVG